MQITIDLTDTQYAGLSYAALDAQSLIDEEVASFMSQHAKTIDGYNGKYRVFEDGRVWADGNGKNFKSGRFLKQTSSHGYRRVFLKSEDGYQSYMVHRLVALAYVPNPDGKPFVNHKNGIKHDNSVENLEWVTQSENVQHNYDVLGHKAPNRLLTDEQANDIREKLACGATRDELADEYNVNRSVIKQIDLGVTYKEKYDG